MSGHKSRAEEKFPADAPQDFCEEALTGLF
jgi:hypothetical protein